MEENFLCKMSLVIATAISSSLGLSIHAIDF